MLDKNLLKYINNKKGKQVWLTPDDIKTEKLIPVPIWVC